MSFTIPIQKGLDLIFDYIEVGRENDPVTGKEKIMYEWRVMLCGVGAIIIDIQ